jgi:hypothetical protein
MRPPGDPALLAAASRAIGAAAEELERLGRRATGIARDLVAGGGWDGPASRAYLAHDGMLDANVRVAASALRIAGEALAGLAAGLTLAQTTWDRARALAASSGLPLDPDGPPGPLPLPLPSTDPRVAVAARVSELLHEAAEQAGAADRAAVAGLAEAARMAVRAGPDAVPSPGSTAGSFWLGAEAADPARGDEGGGSLLGRAFGLADRLVVALGGGFAAIEARAQALLRLSRSSSEPAAAQAAVRTLATFERSGLVPMLATVMPMTGPLVTLVANLAGEHDQEPLLRTVVRSLGESLGADAGQRLGMAICALDAGATANAGAVMCPAITIVAVTAGATLGGAGAARIYDALGPDPSKAPDPGLPPGPTSTPGPVSTPDPTSTPGPGPAPR